VATVTGALRRYTDQHEQRRRSIPLGIGPADKLGALADL